MSQEIPKIPDTPEEIFEDLAFRDKQRKKAVDIARQSADAASAEGKAGEEARLLRLAGEMSDIRGNFTKHFRKYLITKMVTI